MAAIQVGGGNGKRPVDHEVPLIPFIDLLLCCVMFLLATAVWTHLESINANQQVEGATEDTLVDIPPEQLILQVQAGGFVLASTAGDRIEIPNAGTEYDVRSLSDRLSQRRDVAPAERRILVAPDDGISYEDVILAMDTVHGAGYSNVSLSDGTRL